MSQCLLDTHFGDYLILTFPELIFNYNHTCMCLSDQRGNIIHWRKDYSFSFQQCCSVIPLTMSQGTRCSVSPCGTSLSQRTWGRGGERGRRETRENGKLPVRLVLIMFAQICRRFGILITFKEMILTNNSDLNTQEVQFHHVKLAVCHPVLVNWLWLENKWCLISFIQSQRLC